MMTDIQLLEAAIAKSGLSDRQYASKVLTRNERTIRRWLAGDTPIPKTVVTFLQHELAPENVTS